MSSTQRLAVVTGAGSGIGLALTHALIARQIDVIAVDRDIGAIPPEAKSFAFDVRDVDAMQSLAQTFATRPLSFLFANAGIGGLAGDVLSASDAAWRWAWDVNVMSVLSSLRLWWPHLLAGGGKAVATVSSAALQSFPGLGPYRASKAALLAALEGLYYESAGSGVSVHALCPGLVRTNIMALERYEEARALGANASDPFSVYMRQAMLTAEPAEHFAERVLTQLEAGTAPFYWQTHPETQAWTMARHRAIEDGAQPFSDFGPPA